MPTFFIESYPPDQEPKFSLTVEHEIVPRVGEHIVLKTHREIYEVMAIVHHLPNQGDMPTLWVEKSTFDDNIRARRMFRTQGEYDPASSADTGG